MKNHRHSPIDPFLAEIANTGAIPHWLYDLSITDINERKEKKLWFRSASTLAAYLEVTETRVLRNRGIGDRVYSQKFDKEYAIRIDHETQNKKP